MRQEVSMGHEIKTANRTCSSIRSESLEIVDTPFSSVESRADPHGMLICELNLRMNLTCFPDPGFMHGLSFPLEGLPCAESASWAWFLLKKE